MRPVVERGPYAFDHVNVERQRRDPDSLLRWFTRMIRVRKQCPEIGWGTWNLLPTRTRHVLALIYRWRGNAVVCLHNLDSRPHEVALLVPDDRGARLANLLERDESRAGPGGTHRLVLEPYAYRWYRVGGLDYALQRGR